MSTTTQQTFDAAMAAAGSKTTYAGASTSIAGWALSSEIGVLVGIVLGIVGLSINWYYRAKQDRREQAEHERRMKGSA
jgi:hypothetical protein